MERKLAAILAADVVGYSRLAGANKSASKQRGAAPEALSDEERKVWDVPLPLHRGKEKRPSLDP